MAHLCMVVSVADVQISSCYQIFCSLTKIRAVLDARFFPDFFFFFFFFFFSSGFFFFFVFFFFFFFFFFPSGMTFYYRIIFHFCSVCFFFLSFLSILILPQAASDMVSQVKKCYHHKQMFSAFLLLKIYLRQHLSIYCIFLIEILNCF